MVRLIGLLGFNAAPGGFYLAGLVAVLYVGVAGCANWYQGSPRCFFQFLSCFY